MTLRLTDQERKRTVLPLVVLEEFMSTIDSKNIIVQGFAIHVP